MSTTVAQLADALQTLFTTTADRLAKETGFVRRVRKLTGASFAQALVFTWLDDPRASLDDLASACALPGAAVAPQSLDERFTPQAADFLRQLLGQAVRCVLAATPSQAGLLARFPLVSLRDATTIALPAALAALWPGCGGRGDDDACQAGLKLHVDYELRSACLRQLDLGPGRGADADGEDQAKTLSPGALRLADLAYFDLDRLQRLDRQDVYYISRVQARTTLYDWTGRKWKLAAFLARQRDERVDRWVWLGAKQRLPCRLLAIRAPAAVAAKRRQRAYQQAQDHGSEVSADTLEVCGWTVFVSNVPSWLLTLQEAWMLYRLRWQVELLFKLWKSLGGIDESVSDKPYRVLCEVYAKLLAQVVRHWLLLSAGPGFGPGSRHKAAKLARRLAVLLAVVLALRPKKQALRRVLRLIRHLLRAAGRINNRRKRPSAYQTMLDPAHDGLT